METSPSPFSALTANGRRHAWPLNRVGHCRVRMPRQLHHVACHTAETSDENVGAPHPKKPVYYLTPTADGKGFVIQTEKQV